MLSASTWLLAQYHWPDGSVYLGPQMSHRTRFSKISKLQRCAKSSFKNVRKQFCEFSRFLAILAPNMHQTKCWGARDLRVVKVSALCDAWRSKKLRKTKHPKKWKKCCVLHYFCWILAELRQNRCHRQIPCIFSLWIHLLSALYDQILSTIN